MASSYRERRLWWLVRLLILGLNALVLFEAFCFVCWLLIPFFPSLLNGEREGIVLAVLNAETDLFLTSAVLAPVFVVLLLFSWIAWPLRVFLGSLGRRIRLVMRVSGRKVSVNKFLAGLHSAYDGAFEPVREGSKRHVLVLVLSVTLAFLVAVYPYLPSLNPSGRFVGVDIPSYARWLTEMDKRNPSDAFSYAFFNLSDRPLSLFLMYLGWKATGVSSLQAAQFLPVLLGPLLVLATFFFLNKAGFNSWTASLASLFTTFSFHLTAGIFGGLLSNMVSLVFFYLFLGFLFWSLAKRSWLLLAIAIVCQVAVLFAHAYTWWMTLGILGVFFVMTFVKWLQGRGKVWEAKMVFAVIVVNIFVFAVRNLILGIGSSSEAATVAQGSLSLSNMRFFWQILGNVLWIKMGISLMNPILFFLALIGGLAVALDDRSISRLLAASVAAAVVPFVLGDWVVQTRILSNLPVQMFSFLGLMLVTRLVKNSFNNPESRKLIRLFLLLAVLANLNYAFRCSFYFTQALFR